MKHLPSFSRPTRSVTIALVSAAAGIALGVPGLALATTSGQDVPAPPAVPTSASQIQNIDQVKTAIKGYYGDTTTDVSDPVSGTTKLHQFGAGSGYAHQVEGIASTAAKTLSNHQKQNATKAILFDIDDTTLNTYSYEIYSNFVYNPTTNAAFVNAGSAQVFPAVPGMVGLEKAAEAKGYQIYFLTGRPVTQVTGRALAGVVPDRRPGDQHDQVHLHHDPVQVADAAAHRAGPRGRHRRQLRGPVQRPQGGLRGLDVQDPEPDVLPALTHPVPRTRRVRGTVMSRAVRTPRRLREGRIRRTG